MPYIVYTQPATNVGNTKVSFHGYFTGDRSCYAWFEWKKGLSGDITTVSAGMYKIGSGVPFGINLSYLDSEETYYYRAKIRDDDLNMYYGDWVSFTTIPWEVYAEGATNITTSEATLNGYFVGDYSCWAGFQWKEGADGDVNSRAVSVLYKSGSGAHFHVGLTSLNSETIHYYRTYINADADGFHYSDWYKFITSPLSIAITGEATLVGNRIATLNGEIILGGDGCIESGFEWKKEGEIYAEIEVVSTGELVEGAVDKALDLLLLDTKYYFRCYGKNNSHQKFYGEWLSFTTTELVPVVTTQIAIDLEAMSVTGNGTIVAYGDLETSCSKRGFEIIYSFSGTLEEYEVWKSHGFDGDIVLDSGTGLWSGTLLKSYVESGEFSLGTFDSTLDGLICNKTYLYRAKAENSVGWGFGAYLEFTTDELLLRKACTLGIWTILLCAYVKPIPSGSVIKRRGFRWGIYETAQEFDIHEDGDFEANATIGPVDTISFVNSADDNVYDTIVDSAKGFLSAGFTAGKFIDVSATGSISIENEGQFKIISVSGDGGTIEVNVRNTLISEGVIGVTIVDLFALYIVDLDPETGYYSVAYVAIEDSEGNWTVQEGEVAMSTTIVNPFDFEGYDKVEFYKPEREQSYKRIIRNIVAEVISEQQYIEKAGGRRFLDIKNHLIQTKANAVIIGTNYRDRFQEIKSLMTIEYPTPAPLQREDTLDIGFGRIRFKLDDKGVVNFALDGGGLMLFRYRMVMMIRKNDMSYTISKDDVDYVATMELEEA